ncbi:hypothetical protein VTH06DRAFT_1426 [Thermothelomyces fergusii]
MASAGPQTRLQQPSQTTLGQTQTAESTNQQTQTQPQAILRLRGAHAPTRRSVQWRSDVVDNEGLGRKKSKVCCIYHRPRGLDESSDSSSSSDSSGSDSSDSDSDAEGGRKPRDHHHHDHAHDCDGHSHSHRGRAHGKRSRRRKPSPNAYEKMPRYDRPKKDGSNDGGKGKGEEGPQGPQGP